MLLLIPTDSSVPTPLTPPPSRGGVVSLQTWLCLIALGVSCLDPATRRQNDTTILIQQQPEFDT